METVNQLYQEGMVSIPALTKCYHQIANRVGFFLFTIVEKLDRLFRRSIHIKEVIAQVCNQPDFGRRDLWNLARTLGEIKSTGKNLIMHLFPQLFSTTFSCFQLLIISCLRRWGLVDLQLFWYLLLKSSLLFWSLWINNWAVALE